MYEANVGATQRVLDAAIAAGVPRIVYISTVNVFGNTHGRIPDETYHRDLAEGFVSYYDETKYLAHVAARGADRGGGAHRHRPARDGLRRQRPFGDRCTAQGGLRRHGPLHQLRKHRHLGHPRRRHRGGIVAAFDRGRLGEAYILTGTNIRLGEGMRIAARAAGRKPPRFAIPNVVLRLGSRLSPNGGALLGVPPNLREIVSSADGVTYWGSNAKAVAELGFAPRAFEVGVRDAFGNG